MTLQQAEKVTANAHHISNFLGGKIIEANVEGHWTSTETPNFQTYGPESFRVKPDMWEGKLWVYENNNACVAGNPHVDQLCQKSGLRLISVREVIP